MMAVEIPLTHGAVALVDDEDAEWLLQCKWHAKRSKRAGLYACRYEREGGRKKMVRMHRLILSAPSSMEVDHINGNSLDNRKANLRIATRKENSRNVLPKRRVNLLPKGVHPSKNKYCALITADGVRYRYGSFGTPEEAHAAYVKAALELHGDFARVA